VFEAECKLNDSRKVHQKGMQCTFLCTGPSNAPLVDLIACHASLKHFTAIYGIPGANI
jgi:hypothetical protein